MEGDLGGRFPFRRMIFYCRVCLLNCGAFSMWFGGIIGFEMSTFNFLTLKLSFGSIFNVENGRAVDYVRTEENALVLPPKR